MVVFIKKRLNYIIIILSCLIIITEQKAISRPNKHTLQKHWRPKFHSSDQELYAYNRPAKRNYYLEGRVKVLQPQYEIYAEQDEEDIEQASPRPASAIDNELRIRELMDELVIRSRIEDNEFTKAEIQPVIGVLVKKNATVVGYNEEHVSEKDNADNSYNVPAYIATTEDTDTAWLILLNKYLEQSQLDYEEDASVENIESVNELYAVAEPIVENGDDNEDLETSLNPVSRPEYQVYKEEEPLVEDYNSKDTEDQVSNQHALSYEETSVPLSTVTATRPPISYVYPVHGYKKPPQAHLETQTSFDATNSDRLAISYVYPVQSNTNELEETSDIPKPLLSSISDDQTVFFNSSAESYKKQSEISQNASQAVNEEKSTETPATNDSSFSQNYNEESEKGPYVGIEESKNSSIYYTIPLQGYNQQSEESAKKPNSENRGPYSESPELSFAQQQQHIRDTNEHKQQSDSSPSNSYLTLTQNILTTTPAAPNKHNTQLIDAPTHSLSFLEDFDEKYTAPTPESDFDNKEIIQDNKQSTQMDVNHQSNFHPNQVPLLSKPYSSHVIFPVKKPINQQDISAEESIFVPFNTSEILLGKITEQEKYVAVQAASLAGTLMKQPNPPNHQQQERPQNLPHINSLIKLEVEPEQQQPHILSEIQGHQQPEIQPYVLPHITSQLQLQLHAEQQPVPIEKPFASIYTSESSLAQTSQLQGYNTLEKLSSPALIIKDELDNSALNKQLEFLQKNAPMIKNYEDVLERNKKPFNVNTENEHSQNTMDQVNVAEGGILERLTSAPLNNTQLVVTERIVEETTAGINSTTTKPILQATKTDSKLAEGSENLKDNGFNSTLEKRAQIDEGINLKLKLDSFEETDFAVNRNSTPVSPASSTVTLPSSISKDTIQYENEEHKHHPTIEVTSLKTENTTMKSEAFVPITHITEEKKIEELNSQVEVNSDNWSISSNSLEFRTDSYKAETPLDSQAYHLPYNASSAIQAGAKNRDQNLDPATNDSFMNTLPRNEDNGANLANDMEPTDVHLDSLVKFTSSMQIQTENPTTIKIHSRINNKYQAMMDFFDEDEKELINKTNIQKITAHHVKEGLPASATLHTTLLSSSGMTNEELSNIFQSVTKDSLEESKAYENATELFEEDEPNTEPPRNYTSYKEQQQFLDMVHNYSGKIADNQNIREASLNDYLTSIKTENEEILEKSASVPTTLALDFKDTSLNFTDHTLVKMDAEFAELNQQSMVKNAAISDQEPITKKKMVEDAESAVIDPLATESSQVFPYNSIPKNTQSVTVPIKMPAMVLDPSYLVTTPQTYLETSSDNFTAHSTTPLIATETASTVNDFATTLAEDQVTDTTDSLMNYKSGPLSLVTNLPTALLSDSEALVKNLPAIITETADVATTLVTVSKTDPLSIVEDIPTTLFKDEKSLVENHATYVASNSTSLVTEEPTALLINAAGSINDSSQIVIDPVYRPTEIITVPAQALRDPTHIAADSPISFLINSPIFFVTEPPLSLLKEPQTVIKDQSTFAINFVQTEASPTILHEALPDKFAFVKDAHSTAVDSATIINDLATTVTNQVTVYGNLTANKTEPSEFDAAEALIDKNLASEKEDSSFTDVDSSPNAANSFLEVADSSSIEEDLASIEANPFIASPTTVVSDPVSVQIDLPKVLAIDPESVTIEHYEASSSVESTENMSETHSFSSKEDQLPTAQDTSSTEVDAVNSVEVDPLSIEEDPSSIEEDPSSMKEDPSSMEEDPSSMEEDVALIEVNLNTIIGDPSAVADSASVPMNLSTTLVKDPETVTIDQYETSSLIETTQNLSETNTVTYKVDPLPIAIDISSPEVIVSSIEVDPASIEEDASSIGEDPTLLEPNQTTTIVDPPRVADSASVSKNLSTTLVKDLETFTTEQSENIAFPEISLAKNPEPVMHNSTIPLTDAALASATSLAMDPSTFVDDSAIAKSSVGVSIAKDPPMAFETDKEAVAKDKTETLTVPAVTVKGNLTSIEKDSESIVMRLKAVTENPSTIHLSAAEISNETDAFSTNLDQSTITGEPSTFAPDLATIALDHEIPFASKPFSTASLIAAPVGSVSLSSRNAVLLKTANNQTRENHVNFMNPQENNQEGHSVKENTTHNYETSTKAASIIFQNPNKKSKNNSTTVKEDHISTNETLETEKSGKQENNFSFAAQNLMSDNQSLAVNLTASTQNSVSEQMTAFAPMRSDLSTATDNPTDTLNASTTESVDTLEHLELVIGNFIRQQLKYIDSSDLVEYQHEQRNATTPAAQINDEHASSENETNEKALFETFIKEEVSSSVKCFALLEKDGEQSSAHSSIPINTVSDSLSGKKQIVALSAGNNRGNIQDNININMKNETQLLKDTNNSHSAAKQESIIHLQDMSKRTKSDEINDSSKNTSNTNSNNNNNNISSIEKELHSLETDKIKRNYTTTLKDNDFVTNVIAIEEVEGENDTYIDAIDNEQDNNSANAETNTDTQWNAAVKIEKEEEEKEEATTVNSKETNNVEGVTDGTSYLRQTDAVTNSDKLKDKRKQTAQQTKLQKSNSVIPTVAADTDVVVVVVDNIDDDHSNDNDSLTNAATFTTDTTQYSNSNKQIFSDAEITTTNWWRTLPYAEIRRFLNTIFDDAAQDLYEEMTRKSKEIPNGQADDEHVQTEDEKVIESRQTNADGDNFGESGGGGELGAVVGVEAAADEAASDFWSFW